MAVYKARLFPNQQNMNNVTAFILILFLVFAVKSDGCPVSAINETFFANGRPRYLSTPAPHPSGDTVCPDFVGKDSCCDSDTLSDINNKFNAFKEETQKNMEQQLNKLESGFSGLSKLDFGELVGGNAGERLRLLVEKVFQVAKKKFTKLRESMEKCFKSMYGAQAGFLCAACSTSFPVSQEGTEPPKVNVHTNTVSKLSDDCKDYAKLLRDSIDEYHRAKSQIIDYITAEIGIDSEDCTCTGKAMEENKTFEVDVEGVKPRPKNRLLYGEDVYGEIRNFEQTVAPERDEPPPNIVNNKTYGPEKEADEIWKNDTKNIVDRKKFKEFTFSSVKRFSIALYKVISKGMKGRNYNKIPQILKEFIDFSNLNFEEGLSIAKNFAANVKNWGNDWGVIRKLFLRLCLDLLTNMPWSTPTPKEAKQGKKPSMKPIDQEKPKMEGEPKPKPEGKVKPGEMPMPKNESMPIPDKEKKPIIDNEKKPIIDNEKKPIIDIEKKPMPRNFTYQFSMYKVSAIYAEKLGALFATIGKNTTFNVEVHLPYILNEEVQTAAFPAGSKLEDLIAKEVELLKTTDVVILPVFGILNKIQGMLHTLGPVCETFANNYLAKLTEEDMKYIRDAYFPTRYHRRNPKEKRNVSSDAPSFAASVVGYYKDNIENVIKQTFVDCLDLIKTSDTLTKVATKMIMAGRRGHKMEALRNKDKKPSEETIKMMQTCEKNREFIKENKACTNETNCFVCFVTRGGVVNQLNLTAGESVENIDKLIEEAKRKEKMFGKVDISEMPRYDDEEAIRTAKCPRMISARTKLCIPVEIQKALNIKPLDDPAAINEGKVGKDMLKRSMNKKKFKEATDLVLPEEEVVENTRLLLEDEGDMTYVESAGGIDLLNVKVGMSTETTVGGSTVESITATSSAAIYTSFLALLVFGLLAFLQTPQLAHIIPIITICSTFSICFIHHLSIYIIHTLNIQQTMNGVSIKALKSCARQASTVLPKTKPEVFYKDLIWEADFYLKKYLGSNNPRVQFRNTLFSLMGLHRNAVGIRLGLKFLKELVMMKDFQRMMNDFKEKIEKQEFEDTSSLYLLTILSNTQLRPYYRDFIIERTESVLFLVLQQQYFEMKDKPTAWWVMLAEILATNKDAYSDSIVKRCETIFKNLCSSKKLDSLTPDQVSNLLVSLSELYSLWLLRKKQE
eukprot:TRINITY_DN4226_c0_g1_i1.p1 TRINITY_DN4226_c0_g1~~TRINITY_DN4226_c0_g1_i1.p1  ORF type:complete len:1181 (+),score=137.65 TRINITY_DN4226_c0_g1_i1:9890-13432(+)